MLYPPPNSPPFYRVIRNSHLVFVNNVPWSKKKYTKIRTQTQCYIKCWSTVLSSTCFRCFPHVTATHSLRYTVGFCVSFLSTCVCCFCAHYLSIPQRNRNPVVLGLEIEGATHFEKECYCQRICATSACAIDPSC